MRALVLGVVIIITVLFRSAPLAVRLVLSW